MKENQEPKFETLKSALKIARKINEFNKTTKHNRGMLSQII